MSADVNANANAGFDNEKIINKIKHALSYSAATTHADSESALAMAMRLAARHNIDIQAIIGSKESPLENYHNLVGFEFGLRAPTEWEYISVIINEFFNVSTIMIPSNRKTGRTGGVNFIGTKENIEIAKYIYNQLSVQYLQLFNSARKTHGLKTTDKRNYYNGLFKGFYVRLLSEKKSIENELSLAIIKDPKIDEAFSEFYPKTHTKAVAKFQQDSKTIARGFDDSSKLQINKSIANTTDNSNKLLLIN